ncbi:hypothetical protein M885DRAFT_90928 [Pelagophyceae sp. CCMP2097]|nr:hypothetical protein M885DRAFT_90928 [Pelagophyceae sp. CCMP2097]
MRTPPRPSRTPQKVLAPAQPSPSRASYIEAGAEAEVPDREALTPKPRVSDGAGARDGTPMEPRLQALHAATRHHLAERHERFGYDPLDRMVIEARRRKENGLRSNKQPAGDLSPAGHEAPEDFEGGDSEFETEYASDLRRLLRDHVELMEAEGVVFRHAFREKRLGFKICIARYGTDGRCFVTVEETLPHCPLYAGALMPTDEVIAINGTLILEPCAEMFDALRESIEKAERPVDFTFIQGERREEAFAEQEERRGMTGEEPIDLAIYATLVADTRARAASAAESARFAAAALEAFVAGRGEAAEDPLLAAQRAEAYSAQCSRAALRVAAIRVDSRSAKCENDHERASKIIADAGAGAVASAEAALASAQTYHEARRIGRAGALAARAADDDRARKLGQAGALEARAAAAAGAGAANAAEARAAADEAKTAVAELRALEEEWGRGPASGAEAAHFALQVASLCRSATNAAGRAEATAALKERQVEVSRALATAAIAEKAEAAAALKEQEAEVCC